ncbi:hypothetical protein CTH30272_01104 [Allocatenococcus thiocycli]|nr:hypothetical protein CTH30272_01104 [Catenococcus thiocycli]
MRHINKEANIYGQAMLASLNGCFTGFQPQYFKVRYFYFDLYTLAYLVGWLLS